MDIGSASAISSYNFQTAVQGGTQAKAVLQALTQAYSSASASNTGADPLAALVGNANLGPLVSAIYTQAKALNPSGTSTLSGLGSAQTFGGVDPSSATSLLASLGSSSANGLSGFEAAMGANSYLALASYQSSQKATSAPAVPPPGSDAATMRTYIQQVLGVNQAATASTTFNLLG